MEAVSVDEEEVANGADVEAAEGEVEGAEMTESKPAGLAAVVTGSYWNSFFLVLIGANTVGTSAALLLLWLARLRFGVSIAGVYGSVSPMPWRG